MRRLVKRLYEEQVGFDPVDVSGDHRLAIF